ncbi:GGDEF domain-containing protein, partial [Conexibacter sp. JD483]|uniref:GGDEF domain-containing protein n=1 Tax=unclassified Conexibacter TaxID=2627773 RepID=UPI0027275272
MSAVSDEADRLRVECRALRRLLALSHAAAQSATPEEVARRIADAIPEIVGVRRGALTLASPGTLQPAETAASGFAPADVERLFQILGSQQVDHAVTVIESDAMTLGWLTVDVDEDADDDERAAIDARLQRLAHSTAPAILSVRRLEQMRHRALHDTLTGLANSTMLLEQLEQAIARARRAGRPVALLHVDLDDFEQVNETYGRAVGDELLCAVARCLQANVRDGDVVARIGSDEFGVVIESAADIGAAAASDRLLQALNDGLDVLRLPHSRIRLAVSASIGIALTTPDTGARQLLRQADRALHAAKHR